MEMSVIYAVSWTEASLFAIQASDGTVSKQSQGKQTRNGFKTLHFKG